MGSQRGHKMMAKHMYSVCSCYLLKDTQNKRAEIQHSHLCGACDWALINKGRIGFQDLFRSLLLELLICGCLATERLDYTT